MPLGEKAEQSQEGLVPANARKVEEAEDAAQKLEEK